MIAIIDKTANTPTIVWSIDALGSSGSVVGIADPQALADAAIALLNDPAEWNRASQAAIARVERYYTDSMMFGSYRKVYQKALGGPATDEAR